MLFVAAVPLLFVQLARAELIGSCNCYYFLSVHTMFRNLTEAATMH